MKQALESFLDGLKYNSDGLIPAVAQDVRDGQVLMLAYMNKEAIRRTLQTGYACYYSRSRGRLWEKGESSGHRQRIVGIRVDCDLDTLLLMVEQTGVACHEGYKTCFFREVQATDPLQQEITLAIVEDKP